jgi:hypothetical protein
VRMSDATLLKDIPALSRDASLDPSSVLSPSSAAGGGGGGGMFKKRAKTSSAQKGLRKPPTSIPTATRTISISDDDSESEDSDDAQNTRSSDMMAGRKRKRGGIIQAASTRKPSTKDDLGLGYDAASRNSETLLDPKNQAIAVSAEFTDSELLGRTSKPQTPAESASDNLYRGQSGYRTLVQKREQATTKYNALGPQKAASNIRMTTVTDYAPGMSTLHILSELC